MYITVLYTIPFHLLNFIIVLPRGPTPSIGIQHRTSRSYPQPDLWVRGFTHSRNRSPRSRLLGPTPIYSLLFFHSFHSSLSFRWGGICGDVHLEYVPLSTSLTLFTYCTTYCTVYSHDLCTPYSYSLCSPMPRPLPLLI